MKKEFKKWSLLKIFLNDRDIRDEKGLIRIGCYPREIWMCSVGINIGSEEDGKNEKYSRPVVVFKVFNSDMFWGIPFTSKRHDSKFYHPIVWNGKTSWAILSQLRVLSPKRLDRKLAVINEEDFAALAYRLLELMKSEIPLAGEVSEAEALVTQGYQELESCQQEFFSEQSLHR